MEIQEQEDHSPLTLFYAYADKDEKLCEELEKHLSMLQRQEVITGWHHREIPPGTNRNQINNEQFVSAQIIVLLISPDFLASDASHAEMELALERHTAGLSYVIPLLLRPVDWQPAPFAHLQVLPRNGKPVTKWDNQDDALAHITEEIRLVIKQWKQQRSLSLWPHEPFLASARKDLPLTKRLKDDLRVHGIAGRKESKVPRSEQSAQDENEAVRKAVSSASEVILLGTPHTRRSRSVKQALEIAEMYQRSVYLFWMQGSQLAEVMPTGWKHLPVIDARDERYTEALQELIQALGRKTSFSHTPFLTIEQPATSLAPPRNPYKGLQAFRVEDAQDFFGRDRLIEELLEMVKQLLTMEEQGQAASRLLTVLGPSGSGKSSVVMAGLIPRLKEGRLAESRDWIYLDPMVPGKEPLEALTLTLTSLFPERSLKSIREDLEDDSARGLHLLLTTCVKQSGRRVLLVVDQFEELFTQTASEAERQQFIEILLAAISEPHGPLIGVLTLRADFYDRPFQYPELGRLIKSHQVMVFPMETPDLRRVIEQPARLPDVQLTFEEGLVGDLLFDVQGQIGALPLLQFTLDQLFQYREERMLTLQAYQQIGGVKGALAQHTEATYQSLPTEQHQRLARALFLRLINPGTIEGDATRRRIPRTELVVVDPKETMRLAEVTDAFTKARLLTANSVGEVSTVEVSHEALLLVWKRLQDWLHEAREDVRLQQAISEDTGEWNRYGQPADRLYRGSHLREALRWREGNLPSLDEDRFLQACVKERFRVRRRTFLIGAGGSVTTIVIMGVLVNEILFGNEPKSLPLPLIALPYTYHGHSSFVNSVACSRNGKFITSGSADKTVQVWDAGTAGLLQTYKGHTDSVLSVAWSPDGKRIASASADKTVQVWNVSSGEQQFIYHDHNGIVNSVVWSPDGTRIALGSADKTVQIWNAHDGRYQHTYHGHTDTVLSVAWSPDGKHIASSSADQTIQVWDANNGGLLCTYIGHFSSVSSVAWSSDGKRIASASADQTVQVWDANNGNLLLFYSGHRSSIESVAWSPNDKRISSAARDKTVQIWDARSTSSPLVTYRGHRSSIESVAWSPDGKRIASGSDDRTVQVWDVHDGSPLLAYKGHADSVFGLAWSPDNTRIASCSGDRTVQVWDASNGNLLFPYNGHVSFVLGIAWSPDGKYIASASWDKTVQVWDASNGNLLFPYNGHTFPVCHLAWSPDGKHIASASWDKTVQVWDANNGSHPLTYKGHTDFVWSIAWSPDSRYIASASSDKTVQVWDANNGTSLLTYKGHTDFVYSVAWSPNGKRIISSALDKTVQVWDASSGNLLLTYEGHADFVLSVAWSPDGKLIASGSGDKTVQVYDGWAW